MAEWARVWKSVAKRWWRQARASWAAEALWIQERQALREKVAEAYEAYTHRGIAEKGIKLDDVQADADYWRAQCMEVAEEKDKRILELEEQLVDARATIAKLEKITTWLARIRAG